MVIITEKNGIVKVIFLEYISCLFVNVSVLTVSFYQSEDGNNFVVKNTSGKGSELTYKVNNQFLDEDGILKFPLKFPATFEIKSF